MSFLIATCVSSIIMVIITAVMLFLITLLIDNPNLWFILSASSLCTRLHLASIKQQLDKTTRVQIGWCRLLFKTLHTQPQTGTNWGARGNQRLIKGCILREPCICPYQPNVCANPSRKKIFHWFSENTSKKPVGFIFSGLWMSALRESMKFVKMSAISDITTAEPHP